MYQAFCKASISSIGSSVNSAISSIGKLFFCSIFNAISSNGKFTKGPNVKYWARLHKRNEFLINSHHPLRETIMQQTGKTEAERRTFLRDINQRAVNFLIHTWETPQVAQAIF